MGFTWHDIVGARGSRRWSVGRSNQCLMTLPSRIRVRICVDRGDWVEWVQGEHTTHRAARKLIVWNMVMNSNVTGRKTHRPRATTAGTNCIKGCLQYCAWMQWRCSGLNHTLHTARTVPDCLRGDNNLKQSVQCGHSHDYDFVDFRLDGSCRQNRTFSVIVVARLSRRRQSLRCGMSCDAI